MTTPSFQRSQHRWKLFLAFTVVFGLANATRSQTFESAVGHDPSSVRSLEQQIQNLYATAGKAVVRIDEGDSRGICRSGVIVSDDGYVLSRAIGEAGRLVKVHLSDGRMVSAKTLGWSWEWQISLLKIVDEGVCPHVEIGSANDA